MFWTKKKTNPISAEEKKVLSDFNQLLLAVEADEIELIELQKRIQKDFGAIQANVTGLCHSVDRLTSR